MKKIKIILLKYYMKSVCECLKSIESLLEKNQNATLLDCGCDTGEFTMNFAKVIETKKIMGMEIGKEAAKKAEMRGIQICACDLNNSFPVESNFFDVVTANQIIEHLFNTDNFVKEIHRILKPNGYAIISTNNLSSWHNIAALLIGKQPFPADVSNIQSIGKLFALSNDDKGTFAHLRIFTKNALIELFKYHKFEVESVIGVGYYPFPSFVAKVLSKIDKNHAVYATIKVKKVM